MALPPTVRVKLSSEAAESISLTPVIVQEMQLRDLIEYMLGVTGKDEARIRELLLRGTIVSGASRFRWAGWDVAADDLRQMLITFPDPDPERPFQAAHCIRATLRGGRQAIEIVRQAGERKRLFQRESFWDVFMKIAAAGSPAYGGYSYRERADRYLREFSVEELAQVRSAGALMRYTTLSEQIRTLPFTHSELLVSR
jgi:hypothetical protein